MKKLTAILLIFSMCLGVFSACGEDEIPDGPAELWVVTELTDKYGMNDQAHRMIERFNEQYPEVTVKLDILPTEKEERAVYLQKIRTEIMAGDGPDVYLLPTNPTVPKEDSLFGEYKLVDPLFRDVGLTMYKGIFHDISEFYDEDETLNKEELNQSVMDGVLVDDARYVLPLRYDFPVYVVDRENLEARGGDVRVFESGMLGAMAMAAELQDPTLAYATRLGYPDYCFSQYVDYSTETVLLTVDEVAEYFRLYQELNTLVHNQLPM